jgi:voltage-gated potassium channel
MSRLCTTQQSTVTGVEFASRYAFAQVLEIVLAVYSAVIIATIAGALGAYFIQAKTVSTPVAGPWWDANAESQPELDGDD